MTGVTAGAIGLAGAAFFIAGFFAAFFLAGFLAAFFFAGFFAAFFFAVFFFAVFFFAVFFFAVFFFAVFFFATFFFAGFFFATFFLAAGFFAAFFLAAGFFAAVFLLAAGFFAAGFFFAVAIVRLLSTVIRIVVRAAERDALRSHYQASGLHRTVALRRLLSGNATIPCCMEARSCLVKRILCQKARRTARLPDVKSDYLNQLGLHWYRVDTGMDRT